MKAARGRGLWRRRGDDYGVGTMVFDSDALYYVDGEGYELKGRRLPSGAGASTRTRRSANLDGLVDAAAALEIAERAVATAAVRDARGWPAEFMCCREGCGAGGAVEAAVTDEDHALTGGC